MGAVATLRAFGNHVLFGTTVEVLFYTVDSSKNFFFSKKTRASRAHFNYRTYFFILVGSNSVASVGVVLECTVQLSFIIHPQWIFIII